MDWKVRYIDYGQQYQKIRSEVLATIDTVLSQGDLMLRQQLRDFEANLAAFAGTRYAVGTSNCTDALHLVLRAAGIGPGAEVITVSHTFVVCWWSRIRRRPSVALWMASKVATGGWLAVSASTQPSCWAPMAMRERWSLTMGRSPKRCVRCAITDGCQMAILLDGRSTAGLITSMLLSLT